VGHLVTLSVACWWLVVSFASISHFSHLAIAFVRNPPDSHSAGLCAPDIAVAMRVVAPLSWRRLVFVVEGIGDHPLTCMGGGKS